MHRRVIALLLCAAGLCLFAPRLAFGQAAANAPATPPAPAAANGTSSRQQMLTFCVANWEPIVICNNATAVSPANFTGHDVEMVRYAAKTMDLKEGVDFQFQCVQFSDMMRDLERPDGVCTAGAAGITITVERDNAGIKFTYPYYKASLGILVQSYKGSGTGWGFTRPFSWNLWLALLITLIVFPPLIFVIEFLSLRKRIHREDVRPGVLESGWRGAITLMLFDHFAVTSLGARVAVLTFCFLALLITNTYTANLAAFVTVSTITSRITSVQDLRGRAVGSIEIYLERLRTKYGIMATPSEFNSGADFITMRDLVATGQLAAVINDEPAMAWLADNAPNCEVTMLPQTIEPFDYGIAFHVNASDALVEEWSLAILRLQEDGTLQMLKNSWIAGTDTGCSTSAQVNKEATAVSFQDLYGLWIILAAGLALGTLIMIAQRWARKCAKRSRSGADLRQPFPEGRRPLRLASAIAEYVPRRGGKKWRVDSARSSRGARPAGRGMAGPHAVGATAAQEAARADALGAAVELPTAANGWDVEKQSSGAASIDSAKQPQPAAAAGVQPPQQLASQLQQQQPAPAVPRAAAAAGQQAEGSSGADQMERRASALQAAESVYAAYKWKSTLRTKAATASSGDS